MRADTNITTAMSDLRAAFAALDDDALRTLMLAQCMQSRALGLLQADRQWLPGVPLEAADNAMLDEMVDLSVAAEREIQSEQLRRVYLRYAPVEGCA